MRLAIRTTDGQNAQLTNVSDTGLKINYFLSFQIHLKRTRNGENKSVLVKELIVHHKSNPTTVIITTTKRYMHLWHLCLIMTKVLVDISVTVCN